MVVFENECVGCPTEMGCYGQSCPNRNVPHYFCDKCGKEIMDDYDKITEGDFDYHSECIDTEE